VPERTKYLTALTSGSLDCLGRKKSSAKDILWELELWSILRWRSFDAVLSEPPDIVVAFEDAKVSIACKKFYSTKHVQNALSSGRRARLWGVTLLQPCMIFREHTNGLLTPYNAVRRYLEGNQQHDVA
jgi:hypothetical protein